MGSIQSQFNFITTYLKWLDIRCTILHNLLFSIITHVEYTLDLLYLKTPSLGLLVAFFYAIQVRNRVRGSVFMMF